MGMDAQPNSQGFQSAPGNYPPPQPGPAYNPGYPGTHPGSMPTSMQQPGPKKLDPDQMPSPVSLFEIKVTLPLFLIPAYNLIIERLNYLFKVFISHLFLPTFSLTIIKRNYIDIALSLLFLSVAH